MTDDNLAAAVELAAAGWSVFPCIPTGDRAKAPLTEHGQHDASTDPAVIHAWWKRWPAALIGAPVPERLLVLDLDPRNGGQIDAMPPLPVTLTVWSGRGDGGRHLYFRRPAGAVTSTRLPSGWDLKVKGYCIVPPSRHPATGRPYCWDERPVAALPMDIRGLLRPPQPRPIPHRTNTGTDAGRALVEFVARQQPGNINDGLYWAACRAVAAGVLEEVAGQLVDAAAAAAGSAATAAGQRQSWRTIDSARKKASA